MKHLRFSAWGAALVLLAGACQGQPAPPQVPPPEPSNTLAAVPTEAAAFTEALPVPTAVPAAFVGPEMKVGSTFPYVDGSLLVAVPGGPFTMGRPGGSDNPERIVTLGDFWIYRTEVSNQQYAWCVELGGCTLPNLDDNQGYTDPLRQNEPVVGVTWDQGSAYCTFVHARYPTEAESEKAARGPDGNVYTWGNSAPHRGLLNYNNHLGKTTFVTDYVDGRSFYSALNLAGNVWEWVGDWYDALYPRTAPTEDPPGPGGGTVRSVRSSGYKANADQVLAAVRFFENPAQHRRDLGFRCVVEDPTYFAPFCQMQVAYGKPAPGAGSPLPLASVCPIPKIKQTSDCAAGSTPVNNVVLKTSPPTVITGVTGGETCLPPLISGGDTGVHVCPVGITITITAQCGVPASNAGTPSCPSGDYKMSPDGSSCMAIGRPGQCPTGYLLDPTLLCCKAAPGTRLAACFSGYHSYQGACVPDNSGMVDVPGDSIVTSVAEGACQPGGGPCTDSDDPACGCTGVDCPPPNDCGPNNDQCNKPPTTGG